jgi:hypothetical protein
MSPGTWRLEAPEAVASAFFLQCKVLRDGIVPSWQKPATENNSLHMLLATPPFEGCSLLFLGFCDASLRAYGPPIE